MKIFERKKDFCEDCQFSFKKDKMLLCAKTIGMTQPDNSCELYEIKNNNKKYENKNKIS
jgi:hypothetical protein